MGSSKIVTAGSLIEDLRRFEKRHPDFNVACDMPDGTRCCMVGKYTDEDGNLCLLMEEEVDGGDYYDVDSLISCLESQDGSVCVHIAACGLLLDLNVLSDGTVFVLDEDGDAVCCDGLDFGEYEDEGSDSGWLTEAEKRVLAEKSKKQARADRIEYAVLAVLTILVAGGFVYNVWAAVTRSGSALWENILWSMTCLFLLIIGILGLYYNKPCTKGR